MEGYKQPEKFLGKYKIDENGFIDLRDFSTDLFFLEPEYIGRFLQRENTNPEYTYIGDSLKFTITPVSDDGVNYSIYKIHKDSIDEFIKRIKKVY